ncbi:MAG: type II toxin-antitoxin system VapC family toxin [Balneolaceae bacterium]
MTILDTNVLSELMKPNPSPNVVSWTESQLSSELFIASITQSEILYGIALLPDGKRKDSLQLAAKLMFEEDFDRRILPFDQLAAEFYATIAASHKNSGKPISQFDAQIAAIAKSRGAKLSTRNEKDFSNCGIKIINPWTYSW